MYNLSRFINNLSLFIDEPSRIYQNIPNNKPYQPATLITDYEIHNNAHGIKEILLYKNNLHVVYSYTEISSERWMIDYYDSNTDSFLPYDSNGFGGSTNYVVNDAIIWNNGINDYIYRVGSNDGPYRWYDGDPLNTEYISPGNGSAYLTYKRSLANFDGYLWVGGRHNSGTDHAGIVRSTTGETLSFDTYWLWNDHVPPSDPKYDTRYIYEINKVFNNIFWGTEYGQIWGDINGGTSVLFDFSPGSLTVNKVRSIIPYNNLYVACSQTEIAISNDGINWSKISNYPNNLYEIYKIYNVNDVLFILGKDTDGHPSSWNTVDLVNWFDFYTTSTQTGLTDDNIEMFDIHFDGTYFWISDKVSVKKLSATRFSGTTWVETVPWSFITNTTTNNYINDAASLGGYIHYIERWADSTVSRYDPTGIHEIVESNITTSGLCIESAPQLGDLVMYGGVVLSNNPIRVSNNYGSSYYNGALRDENYIYDMTPHSENNINYIYATCKDPHTLIRTTDGSNWETLTTFTGNGYIIKIKSFKNNLYGSSTDGSLYKFNHTSGLWDYIDRPELISISDMVNVENQYMYLSYNQYLYKYDGIGLPVKVLDLSAYGFSMEYYGGLIIIGGGNGNVMHVDPSTDTQIFIQTLPPSSGINSHIYCLVQHSDGFIYAFTRRNDTTQGMIYRMKRELV